MKANILCFAMAAVLSGGVYAQAIIQHAAAVAGATAGTAGGKALSNAIDKALGKAANVTAEAAGTKKAETKPAPAASAPSGKQPWTPQPELGTVSSAGSGKGSAKRTRASASSTSNREKPVDASPVFDPEELNMSAPPAVAPVPHVPTEEDFAKVKEGGAREEVFAALGTPSARITIPDEGHLIEILSYSNGSRRLGSVRLDNGQVVSVSSK